MARPLFRVTCHVSITSGPLTLICTLLTDNRNVVIILSKKPFNQDRIAFAVVNGHVRFTEPGDTRTSQQWLSDFGIGAEEWETLVRGYILPGKVQFFTGPWYTPIDMSVVTAEQFCSIMAEHNTLYPGVRPYAYNGVVKGKPGEEWTPVITLGQF